MPSNNPWPPDLQARVIELWNGRYSAGQIALKPEFRGFSRNAVIGQLWRLRKKCPERFLPSRLPGPRPKAKVKHRVKRRRGNPKGSIGPILMPKIKPPSFRKSRPIGRALRYSKLRRTAAATLCRRSTVARRHIYIAALVLRLARRGIRRRTAIATTIEC